MTVESASRCIQDIMVIKHPQAYFDEFSNWINFFPGITIPDPPSFSASHRQHENFCEFFY